MGSCVISNCDFVELIGRSQLRTLLKEQLTLAFLQQSTRVAALAAEEESHNGNRYHAKDESQDSSQPGSLLLFFALF